ncbi:hypothetical protein BG841_11985 [Marinobacter sp. X15-166B]|nr:hypothetical protein BG841_11985 [Marinobacter sp. X15-166B]
MFLPLLPWLLRHGLRQDSGWRRIIPPHLLAPLVGARGQPAATGRVAGVLPVLMIALGAVTLAGPAWREAPTPLQQQNDNLVIVLDLSLSMLATDVSPDRLTLAKRKIRDLLEARPGSLTALVVYAADGHVVTPLTDDRRTIEGMLVALDPFTMPAAGNRADLGVARAVTLLDQGARGQGRIVLIADDLADTYAQRIERQLAKTPYTLSTLVVGTEEGGPMPLPKHGFIRDNDRIVMAQARPAALAALARASGGASHALTLDDRDIRALRLRSADSDNWQQTERQLTVSRWQDDGYWLLWLLLPLTLWSWRRGTLLLLLVVLLPALPRPSLALDWAGLWARPDQRGSDLIEQDPEQAARRFTDPAWKGSALYRAGEYAAAAEQFGLQDHADAHYNRGNALARANRLEEALRAYQTALKKEPRHADARANAELVQSLLEQQQDQQGQEGQEGEPQPGDASQAGQDNQRSTNGDSESQPGQSPAPSAPDSPAGSPPDVAEGDAPGSSDEPDGVPAKPPAADSPRGGDAGAADQPADLTPSPLNQEQEQWLRRIPDHPGSLLQRKFLQQYQSRKTQPDESDTPW